MWVIMIEDRVVLGREIGLPVTPTTVALRAFAEGNDYQQKYAPCCEITIRITR